MNAEGLRNVYGQDYKMKLLDGIGHVFFVDCMGSDERIEQVARLSYEGGRKRSDTRGLLRYLMRHRHTSPFEQAVITLDIKLPIFVARQLVRHRTQSLNEVSGRYSVLPEEYYTPPVSQICYQATDNKQGRAGPFPLEEAVQLRNQMVDEADDAFATYHQFVEAGMALETARMGLPVSTYTHWVTTWDLHNLLHMLKLRLDPHAQWEVRQYAEAIWKIVQDWCPLTAEAFTDFQLEAVTFSKQDMAMLLDIVQDWKSFQDDLSASDNRDPDAHLKGILEEMLDRHGVGSGRDRHAFLKKLRLA